MQQIASDGSNTDDFRANRTAIVRRNISRQPRQSLIEIKVARPISFMSKTGFI
jgi:hypothetical protein